MQIGIYFTAGKHYGGVYQYSLAMLEALDSIPGNTYVIFTLNDDVPKKYYKSTKFEVRPVVAVQRSLLEKFREIISLIVGSITPHLMPFLFRHNLFWLVTWPDRFSQRGLIKMIDESNLDLMIYPTSSNLSFLANTPSVVAIHDLAHRLYPQFPEVSAGGRWELREYSFTEQTRFAKKILVDSKIGKEDVLNCYPATDPKKIVILPFLPPSYLNLKLTIKQADRLLASYKLPGNFFYYPAKFWRHKHHKELVGALKICHDQGYLFSLVFTGTGAAEFNTLPKVLKQVHDLELDQYVYYLGYIEDEDIVSALYKRSLALTMPTNFGPTNIPVLEAWAIGTPVIYSSVRGCKEQLGNAGISVEPTNSSAWAAAMIKISKSEKLRESLINRGKKRLNLWTSKDFTSTVTKLISEVNL